MTNLTREQILARKVGRGTVTLPDGSTVAVRGLTHAEVIESQEHADLNSRTCYLVSKGLTDPAMSFDDVVAWSQAAGAGDLTVISLELEQLSRLAAGAGKSGVPRSRE